MTFYYRTTTASSGNQQVSAETKSFWGHLSEKKNWRIVQLPNGFFQTEYKDVNCLCDPMKDDCCEKWHDVTRRETLDGAEQAIDTSIAHYKSRLEFAQGPKVVKTFE